MATSIKKILAGAISLSVFTTQVAFGTQIESSFWADRKAANRSKIVTQADSFNGEKRPPRTNLGSQAEDDELFAQLPEAATFNYGKNESLPDILRSVESLPSKKAPLSLTKGLPQAILPFGSIQGSFISPNSKAPIVIHIQDIHELEEPQKNIASIIHELHKNFGVNLIGLEGAEGGFSLDPYRAYPNQEITKGIADYFLKEGLIGGPEYLGLTSPKKPFLWGTENRELYEKNIQAFKDSEKLRPLINKTLKELNAVIETQKNRIYSPRLKDFDRHFLAFKQQKEGLGAYIKYLASLDPAIIDQFPQVSLFLKALEAEEGLNFNRVAKERAELVSRLVRTLSQDSLESLHRQSFSYRLGKVTHAEFNEFLKNLCEGSGVSLENYRHFTAFLGYVSEAEKVRPELLLKELSNLEKNVLKTLANNPRQNELVNLNFAMVLLEVLTAHSMTTEDWASYSENKKEVLKIPAKLHNLISIKEWADMLKPFEDFCDLATRRNEYLVENLVRKMKSEGAAKAVLVCGGFHSEGLTKLLKEKKISFIVVTPRLTSLPKESNYLNVFAHDPLPLEKLFSGEKINLAAPKVLANPGNIRARIMNGEFAAFHAGLAAFQAGSSQTEIKSALDGTSALAAKIPGISEQKSGIKNSKRGKFLVLRIALHQLKRWIRFDLVVKKKGADERIRMDQKAVTNAEIEVAGGTFDVSIHPLKPIENRLKEAGPTLIADILAPVKIFDWFRQGPLWRQVPYYFFVSLWEEGLFRGALIGLFLTDWLFVAGLIGTIGGLFAFPLAHTVMKWLVLKGTEDWMGWKEEFRKDFQPKLSFGYILISIFVFAFLLTGSHLFGFVLMLLVHFAWDLWKNEQSNIQVVAAPPKGPAKVKEEILWIGDIHSTIIEAQNDPELAVLGVVPPARTLFIPKPKPRLSDIPKAIAQLKTTDQLSITKKNGQKISGKFVNAFLSNHFGWIAVEKPTDKKMDIEWIDMAEVLSLALIKGETLESLFDFTDNPSPISFRSDASKIQPIPNEDALHILKTFEGAQVSVESYAELFRFLSGISPEKLVPQLLSYPDSSVPWGPPQSMALLILEKQLQSITAHQRNEQYSFDISRLRDRLSEIVTTQEHLANSPQATQIINFILATGKPHHLFSFICSDQYLTDFRLMKFLGQMAPEIIRHFPMGDLPLGKVLWLPSRFSISQMELNNLVLSVFTASLLSPKKFAEVFNIFINQPPLESQNQDGHSNLSFELLAKWLSTPGLASILSDQITLMLRILLDDVNDNKGAAQKKAANILGFLTSKGFRFNSEQKELIRSLGKSLIYLAYISPEADHFENLQQIWINWLIGLEAGGDDLAEEFNAFLISLVAQTGENPKKFLSDLTGRIHSGEINGEKIVTVLLPAYQSESSPFTTPLARARCIQILSAVKSDEVWDFLIHSFQIEKEPLVLLEISRGLEGHFENALLLLLKLYPEKESSINRLANTLVPLGNISAKGFGDSVFLNPIGIDHALSTLTHLQAAMGPDQFAEYIRDWTSMDKVQIVIRMVPSKDIFEFHGYQLEFPPTSPENFERTKTNPLDFSLTPKPENPKEKAALLEKFTLFDSLIEANFSALEAISRNAGSMNKKTALFVLSRLEKMVDLLEQIASSKTPPGNEFNTAILMLHADVKSIRETFERLKTEISNDLAHLANLAEIPDYLRQRIVVLEKEKNVSSIQNLHTLIFIVHQKSLAAFRLAVHKGQFDMRAQIDIAQIEIVNLNEKPLFDFEKATVESRPLRLVLSAFEYFGSANTEDPPTCIVKGNQLWFHTKLGEHQAELYVNLSPAKEMRTVRLRFQEAGKFEGIYLRVAFLAEIFKSLGMHVEIENNQFIVAVMDKDHGSTDMRKMENAVTLIVRALSYTFNLDWALDAVYLRLKPPEFKGRFQEAFDQALQTTREMSETFIGEGFLPFFFVIDPNRALALWEAFLNHQVHVNMNGKALRRILNEKLGALGLPLIPSNLEFGQAVVDNFYNRAIRRALVRGELILDERGVPQRNTKYSSVRIVMEAIGENEMEALEMAASLPGFNYDIFGFKVVGAIGQLFATRGSLELESGEWIIANFLIHPETGQPIFAVCFKADEYGNRVRLNVAQLKSLLEREGQTVYNIPDKISVPQRELAREMLHGVPPPANAVPGRFVKGLAASQGQGPVTAEVTFRGDFHLFENEKRKIKILMVPYTTPADLDAIRSSIGVVTTGGGVLSHAGITTREFGIPAVILENAKWDHIDGQTTVTLTIRKPGAMKQDGSFWMSEEVVEEKLTIHEGDLIILDGSSGFISVLPAARKELILEARDRVGALIGSDSPDAISEFKAWAASKIDELLPAESPQPEQMDGTTLELQGNGRDGLLEYLEFLLFELSTNPNLSFEQKNDLIPAIIDMTRPFPLPLANAFMDLREKVFDAETNLISNTIKEAEKALNLARSKKGIDPFFKKLISLQQNLETLAAQLGLDRGAMDTLEKVSEKIEEIRRKGDARAKSFQAEVVAKAKKLFERLADELPGYDILSELRVVLNQARRNEVSFLENPVLNQLLDIESRLSIKKRAEILNAGKLIYLLDEIGFDHSVVVGGKAANLGENNEVVKPVGGHVPWGFAITTDAFFKFLRDNNLKEKYDELAKQMDVVLAEEKDALSRNNKIKSLSKEMRNLILGGILDPGKDVGKAIMDVFETLENPERILWAVRSSAVQEDTAGAAFAGAAQTFLFTQQEQIFQKVMEVWASFWLPRGIEYRWEQNKRLREKGLLEAAKKFEQAAMSPAVFIQEMVDGSKGGVYFTRNPVNGMEEGMAEAAHGLPEGIVSGTISGDQYFFRLDGVQTQIPIPAQQREKVVQNKHGVGIEYIATTEAERKSLALNQEEGANLTKIAAALLEHFGDDLDIEFTINGNYEILQVRRVTTTPYQNNNPPVLSTTADLLEPLTQSLGWFQVQIRKTPVAVIYYLAVSLWEAVFFLAGPILSGPVFFLLHPIIRWLVRSHKAGLSWKILGQEILNEIKSARAHPLTSRLSAVLLFNFSYFGILHFAGYPLPAFIVLVAIHFIWDMSVSILEKREKSRITGALKKLVLPQLEKFSSKWDRDIRVKVDLEANPESISDRIKIRLFFGLSDMEIISLDEIEGLLARAAKEKDPLQSLARVLSYQNTTELTLSLETLKNQIRVEVESLPQGPAREESAKDRSLGTIGALGYQIGLIQGLLNRQEEGNPEIILKSTLGLIGEIISKSKGLDKVEVLKRFAEGLHFGYGVAKRGSFTTSEINKPNMPVFHIPGNLSEETKAQTIQTIKRTLASWGGKWGTPLLVTDPQTERNLKEDLAGIGYKFIDEQNAEVFDPKSGHYFIDGVIRGLDPNIYREISRGNINLSIFSPLAANWRVRGEFRDQYRNITFTLLQIIGPVVVVVGQELLNDLQIEWTRMIQA